MGRPDTLEIVSSSNEAIPIIRMAVSIEFFSMRFIKTFVQTLMIWNISQIAHSLHTRSIKW